MAKDMKQENTSLFHTKTPEQVLAEFNSTSAGLSTHEVADRLQKYGKNELEEGKSKSLLMKFLEQFKDVMVIILLIAAVISGFMKELADTFIILAVVIINAVLGVLQESKAEKALAALKKMSSPNAKVKRDGEVRVIKSQDLVPGDIVLLEAGDFVPADMRLLEASSLKIEEAALTGESVPVDKSIAVISEADIVIGDRKNMAYSTSTVTYGRGMGIVTGTGMKTEVGKIAGYISGEEQEQTPLQKKLAEIGKFLSIGIVVIALVIFTVGVLEGRDYFEMFLTAVSLAVAAIPEGLPAIVTIVLAMGVQKMAKNNAIIRKLPAVETLGSTEIICSDKTGTLTQNKMTVKEIYLNGILRPTSEVRAQDTGMELFAQTMALCNDSKVSGTREKQEVIGDPTEVALIHFAAEKGYQKGEMERQLPRKDEIPFDSDRKLMTTLNDKDGQILSFTKGAPDVLLEKCTHILINGKIEPMQDQHHKGISEANASMAGRALRVLAMAYRPLDSIPDAVSPETLETDLTFVGLVGMIDPPREEVKDAVRVCREAGIRPVMITGDHRDTAAAIARELGIIQSDNEVITGRELDKISEEDFIRQVNKYSVYARVSPEHKVRIVQAWKKNGKIVAMTGDGVNDAPALKTSDIGVGMGITGTDVSKGVSDMVLSDDNFATIVLAVKEGRKIYSNIRKSIQFLLSANMGEVITLFVATMLNWKILLPIHILWVNLVTDTFPALALGVEKAEKDIMQQKPRKSEASFFSEGLGINIIYQGILEALLTLGTFYLGMTLYPSQDNIVAVTMAFATLGLIQLTHSLNVRSQKSLFRIGLLSNRYLLGAILFSAFLQLIVIFVPFLNDIFRVTQLNGSQWLIVIAASLLIIPLVELVKLFENRRSR